MRLAFWAVVVLMSVSAAAQRPVPLPPPAQPGPAPRSDVRPTEVQVSIEGCLHGRQLTLMRKPTGAHEMALKATEFLLEGPRELLDQLARDHRGHHELITGIAIIPPSPAGETVDTRTKVIGGVRVTGGVRQTGRTGTPRVTAPADSPRPVRVKVQSATHVAEGCVSSS